ncbi:MAG: hypothetical protein R6W77_10085 [Trueperaceae bacterium]
MTERKRFLLRIDPGAYAEIEKWAADDLRSVNAQIEYLLLQRWSEPAVGARAVACRKQAPTNQTSPTALVRLA